MRSQFKFLSFAFISFFVALAWAAGEYDAGPDPKTEMGRQLIDIVASQPFMPGISTELMGSQKFRPAFGPTLWRMLSIPNSVKILFIGQDGTHIAEAAGRTATAGFGGRAQDLAAYFGVNEGAAFINTFAFTIKGQYGAFSSPVIYQGKGEEELRFTAAVDNGLWLMSQDQNSPMVKWRNSLIDWIIRNNKDSLKMIVLFGGAARDSIGTFIESRGGQVGTRYSAEELKHFKVPQTKLEFAGGNNEFPVILDQSGEDLYSKVLGREVDYESAKDQAEAQKALKENLAKWRDQIYVPEIGINGSGIIHPGQLGGYDLKKISINGEKTISLKGLKLSDGTEVAHDILVAASPHPSALSKMTKEEASKSVAQALAPLKPYVERGWKIQPDKGFENKFAAGQKYIYSRSEIPDIYYDFGTPNNRMVPVSDASRMPGKNNIIVLGTRGRVRFDMPTLEKATAAKPGPGISDQEMFIATPRTPEIRYVFDCGPGCDLAEVMKKNLNMDEIGKPKDDMSWEKNGIDAFNIKTHPTSVGDFGHFRGTFQNPKVVILADPDGYDDILTSRALTGNRGQYLHGLMEDMGVKDQYLVIKTVPFGMEGATDEEWSKVLEQTEKYRSTLMAEVLNINHGKPPVLFIADGKYASQELKTLLEASNANIVHIKREGTENNSGIAEAAREIAKTLNLGFKFRNVMANIPRSHLPFGARTWVGTSGSRVFNSTDKNKGLAFAIVAPEWAYRQKNVFDANRDAVMGLKMKLKPDPIKLMSADPSVKSCRQILKPAS